MTKTNTEAVEAVWQALARHGYLISDDAREAVAAVLSPTATTEPLGRRVEEHEVRRLLRAVYDDLPHKAISPALSKATGVPLGEVIPFDTAIACGWDFCGYERTIRAILAALSAPTRERELRETLRPVREALEQGAKWFEEYADHHAQLAKAAGFNVGKERDAKAERNRERASTLWEAVIAFDLAFKDQASE